jgi:hypothetical protein
MHLRLLVVLVGLTVSAAFAPACAQPAPASRGRAVFVVDKSAYPEIKAGLDKYAGHVLAMHNIVCQPLPDDYYNMKPLAIRAILHEQYKTSQPPLVGAIMVGPIPHALRGNPKEILIPAPLFYEDFDAQWEDKNGDGAYQDDEIVNDRKANPTEIWTAWWVPPANDGPAQARLLKLFLDKLDRYYRGEIVGRDQMLWLSGNVTDVEICEGWTVLLKDSMKPLEQKLHIWCRVGQDEGTFRPNKRKDEFGPKDFLTAFTLQPWQHCHIVAHGNPRGWYWDSVGVVGAPPDDGKPESTLVMDLASFKGTAGNIVTASGCSNGNFRGDYLGPNYDRALGNLLLFSPDTITIAYYGAASPQSTSSFAGYCTELVESLKSDGGSYLAEGYRKMRNSDYSWGTQHYFFRGGDEKILCGDPFARYRDSAPPTAEQAQAVQEKIKAANWTMVGPG